MSNLSLAQEKIVHAPIGQAMQVLASAGSGKTRVLTERVRYILENTKRDSIIALTFTNKAAEEMLSRLNNVADIEERCWIATIHSVAQRILDQYGHTIGLPSNLHIYERDQDRKTIFLQSLREDGIDIDAFLDVPDEKTRKDRERIVQNYIEQFSIIKRNLLTEDEVKQKYDNEKVWSIFQAYQKSLLESGGIDFDDILAYAHKILTEQTWCGQIYRAKYKHICVDEAQDLNKAQYEFIKALCDEKIKSVLMVGDPNQMIYGFNGSSHEYLCKNFVHDFSPVEQYELKENYRSSIAVIELANKLKPNSQVLSEFVVSGRKDIQDFNNEEMEAEWICNKINELLKEKNSPEIEGEISLNKMVVIARNRFVFSKLEEVLSKNGILYSLNKGERQVEPSSLFGKVLDLGIRLRINPKNWVDGKKLYSALKVKHPEIWGQDNQLLELSNDILKSDIVFPDLQSKLLKAICSLDLESPNISKLCVSFSEIIKSLSETSEPEELERSIQELQDFQKCWTRFKSKGLGNSLLAFRNAMALGQIVENFEPSGLILSTVHTMKGLEKDIVFLMGMCEGVFPDYRAHSPKEIEEELNNAFVAVTRAKRWIYITYPKERKMPWDSIKQQYPSRFINLLNS